MPAFALATLLALCASAGAEPSPESNRNLSVTTDGMALVGIADVSVETHVAPHVGVGATVGGGALGFDTAIKVLLAGVNANYYLTRPFSGWHVGTQAKYVWATASDQMTDVHLFGSGTGAAAYAGYKWLRPSGFTALVEVGVGAQRIVVGDGSRKVAGTQVGPAVNLGIGYSF